MILVDANILLYAKIKEYPQHKKALAWLDEQLNGAPRVGLPWQSLFAFLRISTNPRLFPSPLAMREAWAQVEEWLRVPTVWNPVPTERHAAIFRDIIHSTSISANLIPDAHLATLAIEYGLTLCSTDGDFARFAKLNWKNPLQ